MMNVLKPKWIRVDYEDPDTGDAYYMLESKLQWTDKETGERRIAHLTLPGCEVDLVDEDMLETLKEAAIEEARDKRNDY